MIIFYKKTLLSTLKICMAIIVIIFTLALFEFFYSLYRVPLGLYLGDIYVGGKAYEQLERYFKEFEDIKVTFTFSGRNLSISFELYELGIYFDREKTLQEIKAAGKPFFLRNKIALLFTSGQIYPCYNINEEKVNFVLAELEKCFHIQEQNAEVRAEGGKLYFKPHRHGTYLQRDGVLAALMDLSRQPTSLLEIPLSLIYHEADVTVSSILNKGIKDHLYTATTVFNPADSNRVHNIIQAAEQVNNIILKPGDVFSFNALVGDTSLERGYKEAPVIVHDQLVMGAGGGICQVSSTIYNASLMTGMTIIERHNHGLSVAYLPPGLDATVAYNYLDLKFINELGAHVLLHTQIEGDQLCVTFFGDSSRVDQIEILRKNVEEIPAPQQYRVIDGRPSWYREIIQEGKAGYNVETIRIFSQNGKELKREYLGKDYYMPVPHIWAVGNLPEE